MDCIEEGFIQMYIDDEVSVDDKKIIDTHLSECQECQRKMDKQREAATDIKAAINLLATDAKPVPKPEIERKLFSLKKLLYVISAASVLILAIAFFKDYNQPAENKPMIYYELEWSTDANKPIADQDFMINIYNVDESQPYLSIQ